MWKGGLLSWDWGLGAWKCGGDVVGNLVPISLITKYPLIFWFPLLMLDFPFLWFS